jgi:hypothetical protein
MANKYKISSWRVYQIWRGVDPPMDVREVKVVDTSNPTSNSTIRSILKKRMRREN